MNITDVLSFETLFGCITERLSSEIKELREKDTDASHDEADYITELKRELEEIEWQIEVYLSEKGK